MDTLDGLPLEHLTVTTRGRGTRDPISLHVVVAGPEKGCPVVLLHGFPSFWLSWRHQIPALARAGYRVIVPDQLGYGASDKPTGWRPYRTTLLADDIATVIDQLGGGHAHVVGHDWGGGVAWVLAELHAHRVRTLTVLNCPRAEVLRNCLTSNPRQVLKSWYILLFQLPWLPARWLTAGAAVEALVRTTPHGTFTQADLQAHREAATPEAMRAAVSWYKAAFRTRVPDGPITVPTQLIWGERDPILGTELARQSLEQCTDSRLEPLPDAGHWPAQERPEQVEALLRHFFQDHGGPDPYVYKVVPEEVWRTCPDPWHGAPVDLADGFVHLSAHDTLAGTLAKHFTGQEGLLRLTVDPARLPPGTLTWEVSRDGRRFPHVYGPLPRAAVVHEDRLTVRDGRHILP